MNLLEVILIGCLGFFALCQIINAVTNLLTARYMKRQMIVQAAVKEDEARALFESIEAIERRLDAMIQWIHEQNVRMDFQRDALKDIENEIIVLAKNGQTKEKVIRGKYKPRRPKVIEHKEKTPS